MTEYNGEERRTDNTSVRLALLEKGQSDAERRHAENKDSLISVHKRITELKKDFTDSLGKGLDAIIDRIDAQQIDRVNCKSRITALEKDISWLDRWVLALSTLTVAISGWLFHFGKKAQ